MGEQPFLMMRKMPTPGFLTKLANAYSMKNNRSTEGKKEKEKENSNRRKTTRPILVFKTLVSVKIPFNL